MGIAFEARQLRRALAARVLLDGVSLHLSHGSVTTLQGASGSGKTTLLRVLGQLAAAESGQMLLGGQDVMTLAPPAVRRRIALVAQAPVMFPGTVEDNLATSLRLEGRTLSPDEAQALMPRVGLEPSLLGQDARALSGGEKLRVAVARALVLRPEVWLLDEPTAALDADRAELLATLLLALAGEGAAVLVVTHDPRLVARLGGRLLHLEAGRLVPGGGA